MSRTTEYKVLQCNSADDLQAKVLNAIKDGWEPQGGVSTVAILNPTVRSEGRTAFCYYAQAMVRTPPSFGPTPPRIPVPPPQK